MDIYNSLQAEYNIEEKFQWTDPETNQLYWLNAEELKAKNGTG